MSSKLKTKDVEKSYYRNYLQRAEECFNAAKYSFDCGEWNAAAISAIHSCIAACDANMKKDWFLNLKQKRSC